MYTVFVEEEEFVTSVILSTMKKPDYNLILLMRRQVVRRWLSAICI
ncbi:MAG: hypothetical protein ABI772_07400 [Bacteroidota bacterium]